MTQPTLNCLCPVMCVECTTTKDASTIHCGDHQCGSKSETRRERKTLIEIRFTADLITPDDPCDTPNECECSNVYGEWTEHGYGETLESGWYDPHYGFQVFPDKESAGVVTIDLSDPWDLEVLEDEHGGDLEAMIVDTIGDTLGAIDHYDGDTAYASDPITNLYTGERLMVAAHIERNGL